jgi:hypothetical protein
MKKLGEQAPGLNFQCDIYCLRFNKHDFFSRLQQSLKNRFTLARSVVFQLLLGESAPAGIFTIVLPANMMAHIH